MMFQLTNHITRNRLVSISILCAAVVLGPASPAEDKADPDSLYLADAGDNTVKRFNASTGAFQGVFVTPTLVAPKISEPDGPRGLVFGLHRDLLLASQNVLKPFAGDILQYDSQSGAFQRVFVSHDDSRNKPPFAPDGIIVLRQGNELIVADQSDADYVTFNLGPPPNPLPARVARYDTETGRFLADVNYSGFAESCSPDRTCVQFSPRGIVIGPDDALYVSAMQFMTDTDPNTLSGRVIRFGHRGSDQGTVFVDGDTCSCDLARPDGLVFGPDGKLYVTSFRKSTADNDKIVIFNEDGSYADKIDLDQGGGPRAFAQGILFGPGGKLFVPISGNGPDRGSVRRYDVRTKAYDVFIPAAAKHGPAIVPWYLTFGQTDSATLSYGH